MWTVNTARATTGPRCADLLSKAGCNIARRFLNQKWRHGRTKPVKCTLGGPLQLSERRDCSAPFTSNSRKATPFRCCTCSCPVRRLNATDNYRSNRQPQRKRPHSFLNVAFINAGNDLLSHTLSRAVQSALRGLTSVFGMGTGGTPAVKSPTS